VARGCDKNVDFGAEISIVKMSRRKVVECSSPCSETFVSNVIIPLPGNFRN
jgi:hypothetical protein